MKGKDYNDIFRDVDKIYNSAKLVARTCPNSFPHSFYKAFDVKKTDDIGEAVKECEFARNLFFDWVEDQEEIDKCIENLVEIKKEINEILEIFKKASEKYENRRYYIGHPFSIAYNKKVMVLLDAINKKEGKFTKEELEAIDDEALMNESLVRTYRRFPSGIGPGDVDELAKYKRNMQEILRRTNRELQETGWEYASKKKEALENFNDDIDDDDDDEEIYI